MTDLIAGLYKSLDSPPKRPKEYTISGKESELEAGEECDGFGNADIDDWTERKA